MYILVYLALKTRKSVLYIAAQQVLNTIHIDTGCGNDSGTSPSTIVGRHSKSQQSHNQLNYKAKQ